MSDEWLQVIPEDLMTGRAVPPDVIRDLQVTAQLDARTIGRVAEQLTNLHGYAAKDSVTKRIQSCLHDGNLDTANSVVRTLLSIEKEDIERTVKGIDRWRRSTPERFRFFTDELHAGLERNLRALLSDATCIELLRKANRLLREVGNEFQSMAFFCDMRPVFDDSREKVEGFVTLANMRLLYLSQDGVRHACEVALTEDELNDVIEKSERALQKLEVLKAASTQFSSKPKVGT